MIYFFYEFFFTVSVFLLYGLIGGFIIIPLRNSLRFATLAAPMAGMLLWGVGGFLLYQLSGFSFNYVITIVALICIAITICSLFYIRSTIIWRDVGFCATLIAIVCAILTYLNNYASIKFGNPSFLFMDGSDHLGYAAMADWLVSHKANATPIENPSLPYQSFPSLLTTIDPRFGSFFSLGIISSLSGLSSIFAFDKACAVILSTNCLGIAAVFARSRITLILIVLAGLTGFFFPLAQSGYLGKILGFPAMIYILGLFLSIQKTQNSSHVSGSTPLMALIILTFAASMVYPGTVVAYFLIIYSFVYFIISLTTPSNINVKNLFNLRDNMAILLVMILTAFATLGMLSLPKNGFANFGSEFGLSWNTVFLFQFDIQALVGSQIIAWYTHEWATLFLEIVLFINLIMFIVSLLRRNIISASLFATVIFLFTVPYFLGKKWISYELASIPYLLSICGAAWLIDGIPKQLRFSISKFFLIFLITLTIGLRLPAFVGSIERYASKYTLDSMQYSKMELDQLAKQIGNQSVIVDIPNVMWSLPILVEYGRKNMRLQWTAPAWKSILGYRTWPAPKLAPTHLVLGLTPDLITRLGLSPINSSYCRLIGQTRQYQLLNCPSLEISALPWTYKELKHV